MNVIQLLVHAYPGGLSEQNSHGETPFASTYTKEVITINRFKSNRWCDLHVLYLTLRLLSFQHR